MKVEDGFDAFPVYDDESFNEGVEGSSFMQNRELSWLTFNERVLDQGTDESVPLLDRLNFISIFWSNLQEFFMVRVGSLTDLSFIEPPVIDSKTGMSAIEQIRAIHERCHELYPIQESYYEHVRGSLAKQGVRHLRPEDLSDEQRNYLFGLVRHNIEPFLSPQIINSRHPFPHIENGKLYILVRLDEGAKDEERKKKKKDKGKEKKKDKGGAEGVLLGLIPLPHQCERVIKLPGRGFPFILLEHAIEMFVPEIFSMYKIKHTNVICVTRNADFDANQGFDEQDEDYREHMKRLLKQRARLAPVRLECERPLSPVMEKLMLKKLGLKRFQVYDTSVPLDLGFTWGLGSRLSESKREKLSAKPFAPAWPTCFDRSRRILDQVEEHETLMFYPFESMDPFVQLLREASNDASVVSIKITLYRLASQSHLAEALIAAADNGKEVTALFELRARFDENNNIAWSQRFEEAGCNVIYGFRDYKVHSKICCITRRLPDGSLQHITQLGTGNYNEKTARLYTDLSFITTDDDFGRDAVEFFRNMQLENVSDNYGVLRVAPLQIKAMILDGLDAQIARARAGLPASAIMKANSITDKEVIEKISEASNAGVKITMFIRGICCLIPHVKGATENVRVVSIVGRLLEHSRIYCFGSGDDITVYLSSADLMTRNLNKRVEIAWPILDPVLKNKVLTYVDICMHDTAKLRELRANCTYTPLGAFCDIDDDGNPKPPFDAQNTLITQAAAAAEAVAEEALDEGGDDASQQAYADGVEKPAQEPAVALAAEPDDSARLSGSDDSLAGTQTFDDFGQSFADVEQPHDHAQAACEQETGAYGEDQAFAAPREFIDQVQPFGQDFEPVLIQGNAPHLDFDDLHVDGGQQDVPSVPTYAVEGAAAMTAGIANVSGGQTVQAAPFDDQPLLLDFTATAPSGQEPNVQPYVEPQFDAQLPAQTAEFQGQLPVQQMHIEGQLPTQQVQFDDQLPAQEFQAEGQLSAQEFQVEGQLPTQQVQFTAQQVEFAAQQQEQFTLPVNEQVQPLIDPSTNANAAAESAFGVSPEGAFEADSAMDAMDDVHATESQPGIGDDIAHPEPDPINAPHLDFGSVQAPQASVAEAQSETISPQPTQAETALSTDTAGAPATADAIDTASLVPEGSIEPNIGQLILTDDASFPGQQPAVGSAPQQAWEAQLAQQAQQAWEAQPAQQQHEQFAQPMFQPAADGASAPSSIATNPADPSLTDMRIDEIIPTDTQASTNTVMGSGMQALPSTADQSVDDLGFFAQKSRDIEIPTVKEKFSLFGKHKKN